MDKRKRRAAMMMMMGGKAAVPWYLAGGIDAAKCVVAYRPKGAADLASSYINLANPGTYNAVAPVAAPTFDASVGWIFDGLTQYLSTEFIPLAGNEYSMIIRFSDYVDPGGGAQTVWCGYEKAIGSRRWYLGSFIAKSGVIVVDSSSISGTSNAATGGVWAARMCKYYYYNGANEVAAQWGTLSSDPLKKIRIGAVQENGDEATAKKFSNFKVQAFALYGANSAITEAQIQAVTTAMAAL